MKMKNDLLTEMEQHTENNKINSYFLSVRVQFRELKPFVLLFTNFIFQPSFKMPDFAMATNARQRFTRRRRSIHRLDDGLMAFPAGAFRDFPMVRLDAQRIGKSAGGKSERMPESIRSFGGVLGNDAGRRVAVVANRDGAMARLDPAVVLLAHHVAVGARRRIVGQIRAAFGVNERVSADAGGETNRHAEYQDGNREFVACSGMHSK
jgi:hypothetical protein